MMRAICAGAAILFVGCASRTSDVVPACELDPALKLEVLPEDTSQPCGPDGDALVLAGDVPPGCELVAAKESADGCESYSEAWCAALGLTKTSSWVGGASGSGLVIVEARDRSCMSRYDIFASTTEGGDSK